MHRQPPVEGQPLERARFAFDDTPGVARGLDLAGCQQPARELGAP